MRKPVDRGLSWQLSNPARILREIGRDITSAVDSKGLCSSLAQTLGETCGFERVHLCLSVDGREANLLPASAARSSECGESAALYSSNAPLNASCPPVRGAVIASPKGAKTKIGSGKPARLEIEVSLPLRARGEVMGTLNLVLKDDQKVVAAENADFLTALADQIAIGIENVRARESLKESQKIIRQANRLASLGQLTAGLAHEIRNPLVAIRTFAQLLPERYGDTDFRDNFQTVALKEVDRISGLVNDLLNFARPSDPNVSQEDINEIVEGVVRILETQAKEHRVQINCCFSSDLPKIFVDKGQIKQVCMNVLLNALQAIEGEGLVAITTRCFAPNDSQSFVQIEIKDNGRGIAEMHLENIFQPFFTTKIDGGGLGLFISRQIVQDHGGYVMVESRIGEGTTFRIHLAIRQFTP